jgi:HAT1-interacting factor 1
LPTAIPAAQTDAPTEPEKEQTLDELITSANLQYSLKNYDAAAEVYSKATERQAAERGEMEPENAELLFLYGRCLYKVAVSRSDVLGGQVAGEAPKRGDKGSSRDDGAGEAKGGAQVMAPFIAVGGVDTDSEAEGEEADGEAEEEEDDFATAFEVLDLSRVLFEKKMVLLAQTDAMDVDGKGKGKAANKADAPLTPELRHVKDRLADTHDLQAEISLENERFGDAVKDGQATLALRLEIESPDSELIAEAYYKVALAQEFTFFTSVREAKEAQQEANGSSAAGAVEPKMLYDAIENLVKAIESCELRVRNEEAAVASLSPQDASVKRLKIADVKEIVQDMNTRVCTQSSHVLQRR